MAKGRDKDDSGRLKIVDGGGQKTRKKPERLPSLVSMPGGELLEGLNKDKSAAWKLEKVVIGMVATDDLTTDQKLLTIATYLHEVLGLNVQYQIGENTKWLLKDDRRQKMSYQAFWKIHDEKAEGTFMIFRTGEKLYNEEMTRIVEILEIAGLDPEPFKKS